MKSSYAKESYLNIKNYVIIGRANAERSNKILFVHSLVIKTTFSIVGKRTEKYSKTSQFKSSLEHDMSLRGGRDPEKGRDAGRISS